MFNFQPKVQTEEIFNIRYSQVWESSKLFGRECYYIQATDVETNDIFKEVTARNFESINKHTFYYTRDNDTFFNGTESFGGFGYLPMYSDIKYIAKKWFDDVDIEPLEGDLIYDVIENVLFEITKVDENISEYNGDKILDRVFNHKLYLELYKPDYNDTLNNNILCESGIDCDSEIDTNNDTLFDDINQIDLNNELTTDLEDEDMISIDLDNPFGLLN